MPLRAPSMFNRLIHWSIHNRFIVAALALALAVSSFWLWHGMDVDVLPEFAPPQVVIQTEAPGLVAEEVESLVSIPIETALNGTPGVNSVKSLSMNGISKITVLFKDGSNVYADRQLIQEKIQLVKTSLPQGASTPVMEPVMSELGDIIKVGMTSQDLSLMDLRTLADWEVRNRLLAVSGVARVVVFGGDQRQFQVLIDSDKMRSANVTLAQVSRAVRQSNAVSPGGSLLSSDQQIPIHGMMRASSLQDIADAVIVTRNGVPVQLKHVAKVELGPAFPTGDAVINGKRGIEIVITKQPWVGTLDVTARVQKALSDIQSRNPKVTFVNIFRQADFIEQSIANMVSAICIGGVIVVSVLLVFLFNWRTSAISLTAIPASLICAIFIIKGLGGSINTMTLGGLAIAVGEVVDDAVVDVENAYRRVRQNWAMANRRSVLDVIYDACVEVRSSVVYATFIVALVFVPVFMLSGVEGRLFGQLGISYVAATISSLLVALTITPALTAYLLAKRTAVSLEEPVMMSLVKRFYSSVLALVLGRPRAIVVMAVVVFLLSASLLPFMGHAFLPEFQEKDLMVPTSAMAGQSLEASTRSGLAFENALTQQHGVSAVGQRVGRAELDEDAAASSFSEFDIKLSPEKSLDEAREEIRQLLAQVPGITFEVASFLNDHINDVLSGGTQADVVIKIFGADETILRETAARVAKIVKEVKGTADVTPEQQLLIPQVNITINRQQAARYGLNASDVLNTISTVLGGQIVSQVLESQKLFGLRIWGQASTRSSLDDIKALPLDTATGAKIPLSEVADVRLAEGPNAIVRENVNRRITVLANITGKNMVGIVDEVRKRIDKSVALPTGYYIVYSGQYAAQKDSAQRLSVASLLALLAAFVLLSQGLASWRAALLVASNLPLAAVGGIFAVTLTGNVLTIGSLIGFISLFGISTRNSLLLVSHISQLVKQGVSLRRAVYQGCLDRVAPVLMTALTAALGMLPLAILGGSGRELEQPLAIVIIGGLISSTFLTLIVIPALYTLFGKNMMPRAQEGNDTASTSTNLTAAAPD